MRTNIKHLYQERQALQKKTQKGFTLVELLVSMTITLIIIGLLMGMTKMAVGAWHKTQTKTRSSKLAQEVFDSIGKDLEGMVVRTGNNFEWLLISESPEDTVGDRGPTTNKEMLNPLDISFFSAVTDRYDGQIGVSGVDNGGDISMVRYRLIHQDLIGGSVLKPVFALYRERINPDETFTEMLAQPTIDGIRDSSEIVEEANFLAENIFDFTLSFNFEYTLANVKQYKRVVIRNSGVGAGLSIKGNQILVNGVSIQTPPPGNPNGLPNGASSARLAGVDVSILVLSDGGMNGLQNANITTAAQFAAYLKEHGHLYSKSVIVPRP